MVKRGNQTFSLRLIFSLLSLSLGLLIFILPPPLYVLSSLVHQVWVAFFCHLHFVLECLTCLISLIAAFFFG